MSGPETGAAEPAETPVPVLRVVSGNPGPEEIAVLGAVVAAVVSGGSDGGDPAGSAAAASLWSRTSRVPGHRLPPGPGAWRASGLPH